MENKEQSINAAPSVEGCPDVLLLLIILAVAFGGYHGGVRSCCGFFFEPYYVCFEWEWPRQREAKQDWKG